MYRAIADKKLNRATRTTVLDVETGVRVSYSLYKYFHDIGNKSREVYLTGKVLRERAQRPYRATIGSYI